MKAVASRSLLTQWRVLSHSTQHWLWQRITAVLLIPLSYWLIKLLALVFSAPYSATLAWLKAPVNSLLLALWMLTVCYHAALGMQVVFEDYMALPGRRVMIWAVKGLLFLLLLTVSVLLWRIVGSSYGA